MGWFRQEFLGVLLPLISWIWHKDFQRCRRHVAPIHLTSRSVRELELIDCVDPHLSLGHLESGPVEVGLFPDALPLMERGHLLLSPLNLQGLAIAGFC